MESVPVVKPSHKEWRRTAKKERRRRLRKLAARTRDADAERLNAKLLESAEYLNWLESEREKEKLEEIEEAKEHDIREQKWLEEELSAQKDWRIVQERKAKARQEQLDQEERIRKEYEAKQEALRLKKEEALRREEEETKKQLELRREIDEYINAGKSTPEVLRTVINTQPGKDLCPFFSKTGACRYGDTCSRNHQRLALSKVLLIPGFYSHFSLEKNSAEYDTDVVLEYNSSEMRDHFREFYNDVVPELESFGRIRTLRFCRNGEIHLRGNMYVEYYTEREAARACRSLKGRWYAGRQLNCEFTNLKSWRNAVCGMPKCPKGRACNFLHTFRNPRDEYDVKSPPRSRIRVGTNQDDRRHQGSTPSSRSSRYDQESVRGGGWQHQQSRDDATRNWRWSESSDSASESPSRSKKSEERRRSSQRSRKRGRDSRRSRSKRSEDDGSENDGRGRRARVEDPHSGAGAKKKRAKRKSRSRDGEVEDRAGEASKNRESGNQGSERIKSAGDEDKRETERSGRDSARRRSGRVEKSKWDDPNVTTESEGESRDFESRKRRRRASRRSRTRSWSDAGAGEEEKERKIGRSPHR